MSLCILDSSVFFSLCRFLFFLFSFFFFALLSLFPLLGRSSLVVIPAIFAPSSFFFFPLSFFLPSSLPLLSIFFPSLSLFLHLSFISSISSIPLPSLFHLFSSFSVFLHLCCCSGILLVDLAFTFALDYPPVFPSLTSLIPPLSSLSLTLFSSFRPLFFSSSLPLPLLHLLSTSQPNPPNKHHPPNKLNHHHYHHHRIMPS